MATALQRLCLTARGSNRSVKLRSNILAISQARSFHDTPCRTSRNRRRKGQADEASTKFREVYRREKRTPVEPSAIDAPRQSSSRLVLDSLSDADLDKVLAEGDEGQYKTFIRNFGAALSPEPPVDYTSFNEMNGSYNRPDNLDPTQEGDIATRTRVDERRIEAINRHLEYIEAQESGGIDKAEEIANSKAGLVSLGDFDDEFRGPDEPFEGDDITSVGHGYLEQHREIREYYRLAAWELPLLSQHAKEFELPTDKTPLRFRYTSYMGETHPAEKKVIVEFSTSDLPLTPKQRRKLVKLLGSRYNPQKDVAKMSCESFPEPAQNKRYLSDLVDSLMAESRLESTEKGAKDTFDDMPADFRYMKWKKPPKFPDAWKMTPERRERLFQGWTAEIGRSQQAMLEGKVVDGVKTISHFLGSQPAVAAAPQTVKIRR